MPRLAPAEAKEYRFTLGDYERREIVKPIGEILEQSNTTLKHARYIGYATLAVGSVTVLGAAWFIGKGISGVWDDIESMLPTPANLNPFSEDSWFSQRAEKREQQIREWFGL